MQIEGSQTSPEAWDPISSASFWINRRSKALLRLQEERLRPLGFRMSQMPVLHALEDGGSLSQKELAIGARVEQPTMAEMLTRMERDGVVQRAPNPQDGRGNLTSLTQTSQIRLPEAKRALIQVEGEALAGFSPIEKEQLLTLLQRVVSNLET